MTQTYPNYTNMYVAYLDMLGIKNEITSSKDDLQPLKWLFNNVEDQLSEINKIRNINDNPNCMISLFSDSIYIIYPPNKGADLLQDVSDIIIAAANCNTYFRGGITFGSVYIEKPHILFGPALTTAYMLENKIAIFPRIVIDQSAYNHLTSEKISKLIFEDKTDGLNCLNFLNSDNITSLLPIFRHNLEYNEKYPDKNIIIRQKMNWLVNYYKNWVNYK